MSAHLNPNCRVCTSCKALRFKGGCRPGSVEETTAHIAVEGVEAWEKVMVWAPDLRGPIWIYDPEEEDHETIARLMGTTSLSLDAIRSLQRGISQAERGELESLGSFTQEEPRRANS